MRLTELFEQLRVARTLTPAQLRRLASLRLSDLLDGEVARARVRVGDLSKRYPTAGERELSQLVIEQKKQLASVVGGVTGVFGAITVPVDLVGMVYLQLSLLTEVSTAFKAPLHSEVDRQALLDLFGYANGIGPLQRASPRVLGSLARMVLARGGFARLSRAMPLVAAPISAWVNHQHIQRVGDTAIRHFEGWRQVHEKHERRSGR